MSYNTLAEAQASNAALTQDHLDTATLYLDSVFGPWPGVLVDAESQTENWPRIGVDGSTLTDSNGRQLTGIPAVIKQAEILAAGLVLSGEVLLPTTVASATSASTQNSQLIEQTVKAGSVTSTKRYSPEINTTSSSSTQTVNSEGLPVVARIRALLKPITDSSGFGTARNYMLYWP